MTAQATQIPTIAPPRSAGGYRLRECLYERGGVEWWAAERDDGSRASILRDPLATNGESPGLAWEERIRQQADELGLCGISDRFEAEGGGHLVLKQPPAVTLWDVWDDPVLGARQRYARLVKLAELLRGLHRAGAALEGLRPEQIRVSATGRITLDPTVVLLPVPAPRNITVRPSLVSPPELHDGQPADPRSDL